MIRANLLITATLMWASTSLHAMSDEPSDDYLFRDITSKDLDPVADAEMAIENEDLRLLGLALRSAYLPGIESEQRETYIERCGIRLIEGVSDTVKNDADRHRLKNAQSYSVDYNRVIRRACDGR